MMIVPCGSCPNHNVKQKNLVVFFDVVITYISILSIGIINHGMKKQPYNLQNMIIHAYTSVALDVHM